MEKELKLYVWKDVLRDYTAGMAFALAHSYEEAVGLACQGDSHVESELVPSKCEILPVEPYGEHIYGGG